MAALIGFHQLSGWQGICDACFLKQAHCFQFQSASLMVHSYEQMRRFVGSRLHEQHVLFPCSCCSGEMHTHMLHSLLLLVC
jgi:hypothetical protein